MKKVGEGEKTKTGPKAKDEADKLNQRCPEKLYAIYIYIKNKNIKHECVFWSKAGSLSTIRQKLILNNISNEIKKYNNSKATRINS